MKNRMIVSVLVMVFAVFGVVLHFVNEPLLARFCQEDGVVESLTALFYLAACGLFVLASRPYALRNVSLWGFALLFLFVAGEEISWGQRALGISTPAALAEINVQQETSLHNIEGIHGNVRALALVVIFGICYLIPLSNLVHAGIRRLFEQIRMPIFPIWAIGIVTVAILLMAVPRLMFGAIIFELDELGEVIFSFAFLVFSVNVVRAQLRGLSSPSFSLR